MAALAKLRTVRTPTQRDHLLLHNDLTLELIWLQQAGVNQFLPGCDPDLGLGKLARKGADKNLVLCAWQRQTL